jgi:hypothetical protein
MCPSPQTRMIVRRQRGAAMMVMLIIMIIGTIAFLVSSLSSSAIATARNATTTDALAQAKDALIGRAASDNTVPGSLPCPDTHAPGSSLEGTADFGTPCTSYIGRLPWKTLGLPDLRDGSGERLWYALSINYRDVTTSIVNSDTPGTISTFASDGTLLNDGTGANGAVAVIIAPGNVITRQGGTLQDRSSAGTTTASNYLDVATVGGNTLDNSVFTGSSTLSTGFIQGPVKDNSGNVIVNDQILVISRDQLMHVVEMRIAREVKKCLDDFAAASVNTNHRYPWAALVSNITPYPGRTGTYQVLFGRVGDTPSIDTSLPGTPPTGTLQIYIQALQTALANYISTSNTSNLNALNNAGDTLKDYAQPGSSAQTAGVTADSCTLTSCNTTTLQNQLNTAMGAASVDSTMGAASWPPTCTLFSSSYWSDWRDLVFYQVADGYQPQSTPNPTNCILGTTCLTISSSGSYRAAVLVSRKALVGQTRPSYTNPPDNYLETNGTISNSHTSAFNAMPPPSVNFLTYRPSDSNYSTVNDLVLCLDGNGVIPIPTPPPVCK